MSNIRERIGEIDVTMSGGSIVTPPKKAAILRKQWIYSCKAAGFNPISTDTAARIMAIVYEFDREDITHCPKLLADLEYIQSEYGIDGGKIPHSDFQRLFSKYAREIESNDCEPTGWAKKLMKDNYNIKL